MRALFLSLLLLPMAACGAESAAARCGRHGAAVSPSEGARPLPALTGRVADGANLLTGQTEGRLTRQLEALEAETRDQLVIVTVPSLNGEAIESFGLRVGNGWGIGQKELDNGVLLIVAPEERRARIEVGCGLEGLLTDEKAQQIMDEQLIPRFRAGSYDEGVGAGVASIVSLLRSDRRRPRPWIKAAAE